VGEAVGRHVAYQISNFLLSFHTKPRSFNTHDHGYIPHAVLQAGLADPSSPMHTVARHILMQQLDGELARAYSFDRPDLSFHCIA
jgi:hypothetical protein